MLYTITPQTENYSRPLKLSGKGFQFLFNLKNLYYFEDGLLLPNQDVELTPYFPTAEELPILLKEYTDWCSEHNQPQDETLIGILSKPDYWKKVKHDQVDAAAAKFEDNLNKQMYFTSALGFRINGDRRTATNIAGLISTYDIPPNSGKPVQYRDYDNQDQSLNKEQLQQMYLEHLANGNTLYQQKWAMEAAIDAAQSLEELEAIDTEFKMADFTQPLVQDERKLNLNIFGL